MTKIVSKLFLVLLITSAISLFYVKYRRERYYDQLKRKFQEIVAAYEPQLEFSPRQPDETPSFADHIAVIPDFLPAETFERLKSEIVQHNRTERTYLPAHKQGGTIAYETLHQAAPNVVAFYNSAALRTLFSDIVGEPVQPTPIHDQSSCSLLFYTEPGDHINWHYDHNFYNGRHFTVLMPIVNQHNREPDRLSSAQLMVKRNGRAEVVPCEPNTLIIFEGAKVSHKVTRLGPDETRIMLSMTFATTPEASAVKAVARRFKDVAFFGIRALWT